MNTAERVEPAAGSALSAALSAAEIDIRCATVLARIALQTLADLVPEAQARIAEGLDHAVDGARLEAGNDSDAVIGLLTEVKRWLKEETERSRVVYLE